MTPKYVFFTVGKGYGSHKLESFENALKDAKIEKFNLVPVSSIFPKDCKIISVEEGLKKLTPGQIVFCVMAKLLTNKSGIYSTAIGYSKPENDYGYFTEVELKGKLNKALKLAEELALKFRYSNNVGSFGIEGKNKKSWMCLISCAVFII